MKTIVLIIVVLAQIAFASPKIFTGGKQLHSGKGEGQTSEVFEFKGPYAIRWSLRDVKPQKSEDSLAEYWRPHTDKNPPWVSIRVMDADTRKVIESEMVTAWESTLQVEVGGKHYLVITGEEHVAWTIWGIDGVLAKNSDGIRKVTDQDMGKMTVQQAAEEIIADLKDQHQGAQLDERMNAVALIQSRASGVDDFVTRWKAYCKLMKWE